MKLTTNPFIRSVAVLMTGTVFAQAIGYLISPILTRLYTAEEMGELGIYMRAVGFIAALATARYELSLPLPKRDQHAYLLYRMALRIALLTLVGTAIVGLVYLFARPFSANDLHFAWLTLASAAFLVMTNLGTNWAIRKKAFNRISNTRVINAAVANGLRWAFGLLQWGGFGLMLATFIGYAISSLAFVREWLQIDKHHKADRSPKKTRVLSIAYREFPLFNFPHVLVDLGRDLLIAALVVAFFSKAVFGYYNHSYAMLRLPLVVVGTSIGQVFFNRAAEHVNAGASMLPLLKKTLALLALLSVVPFAVVYFYGEEMFGFVFGADWAESGRYAEIMAVWLMFNFITSAVSTAPIILNRQKAFFIISLLGTSIQLLGFGVLPKFLGGGDEDFRQVLLYVSIAQAIYMVGVALATLYYAKKGVKPMREKRPNFESKD